VCAAHSNHDDYDGHFLAEIIASDPDFLNCYLDKMFEETSPIYRSHHEWVSRLGYLWKDSAFEYYMDQISDYIFEKTDGNLWKYGSIIGQLLLYQKGATDVAEKQEKWIQHIIEKDCFDQQRMYGLFRAIDEHSANRRKNALEMLLKLNSDYTLFEKLPLEASGWGGYGSMIPYMQERITYLTLLMPLLSSIKYLKHRQRVERDIEIWKNRIKSEEIRELLESLG
jgi:hypothetical protein